MEFGNKIVNELVKRFNIKRVTTSALTSDGNTVTSETRFDARGRIIFSSYKNKDMYGNIICKNESRTKFGRNNNYVKMIYNTERSLDITEKHEYKDNVLRKYMLNDNDDSYELIFNEVYDAKQRLIIHNDIRNNTMINTMYDDLINEHRTVITNSKYTQINGIKRINDIDDNIIEYDILLNDNGSSLYEYTINNQYSDRLKGIVMIRSVNELDYTYLMDIFDLLISKAHSLLAGYLKYQNREIEIVYVKSIEEYDDENSHIFKEHDMINNDIYCSVTTRVGDNECYKRFQNDKLTCINNTKYNRIFGIEYIESEEIKLTTHDIEMDTKFTTNVKYSSEKYADIECLYEKNDMKHTQNILVDLDNKRIVFIENGHICSKTIIELR